MQQPEAQPSQPAVTPPGSQAVEGEPVGEAVHHPAKVMRIGTMVRQLLEEIRAAPLDQESRDRLKEIYETSVSELSEVLSPDLRAELDRLSFDFEAQASPSDAELRVAHAQLVGWLEGLFHGIQAMLFAQQVESQQRLQELRRPGLPSPQDQGRDPGQGTYL
ncbi:MAG TPA: proteasome activator [Actinomycetota bacterium]|nr:proteasome activator [Actinomycetota bacterium]